MQIAPVYDQIAESYLGPASRPGVRTLVQNSSDAGLMARWKRADIGFVKVDTDRVNDVASRYSVSG